MCALADDPRHETHVERRRRTSAAGIPVPRPGRATVAQARSESSPGASAPSLSTTRLRSARRQLLAGHAPRTPARSAAARPRRSTGRPRRRGRRTCGSAPGSRLLTRSSASRRWNPAIERPEPLSSPSLPRAKTIAGAMKPVLEPRGDDADDALMPRRTKQAERVRVARVERQRRERIERLVLHRRLDVAPLAIEPIELARRARSASRRRRQAGSGCRSTCRRDARRR